MTSTPATDFGTATPRRSATAGLPAVLAAFVLAGLAGALACGDDNAAACEPEPPYEVEMRNPQTGACEIQTLVPGCGDEQTAAEPPRWGACESTCEALEVSGCQAASHCQVAYLGADFLGCWDLGVAAVPPQGGCEGNTAAECTTRAECSPIYQLQGQAMAFSACQAEIGAAARVGVTGPWTRRARYRQPR